MLPLLAAAAGAFCGLYVGTGQPLHNQSTQIVVAHNADGTVALTLAPDYDGDLADFGLVIPVPAGTGAADVEALASSEALDHLDAYTAPRMVRYRCEDLYPYYWDGAWHTGGDPRFSGCSGGDFQVGCSNDAAFYSLDHYLGEAEGVAVEDHFTTGAYDIAVLSTEDSQGLLTYLAAEGYALDASAEDALQSYIDADLQFLVARVVLDQPGETWLTPLQIRYTATTVTIPIRLGTENATGPQDLQLYLLDADGQGTIQNYPMVPVTSDCMAEGIDGPADLPGYWDGVLDATFSGQDAAWTTVFAWDSGYACDPCPPGGQIFFDTDAAAFGYTDGGYPLVTRLHARWNPDAGLDDLVLGFGNEDWGAKVQATYIVYDPALEGDFPVCGEDAPRAADTLCAQQPPAPTRSALPPVAILGAIWLGIRRLRR
jgi:hypothetical protein